jgi:hypothetical protein
LKPGGGGRNRADERTHPPGRQRSSSPRWLVRLLRRRQGGHIGIRAGVLVDEHRWGWHCGFYPGCDPGQATDGTGETFEEVKAEFEEAWNRLWTTRTEAHYELWLRHRDFTAWKYRMQDEHLKTPTQTKNDRTRCFCGAYISNRSIDAHIQQRTAASAHSLVDRFPAVGFR